MTLGETHFYAPHELQDDLADGAGPSGDQQPEAPQPNAPEEEAAAAVRPDQDEADCKPPTLPSTSFVVGANVLTIIYEVYTAFSHACCCV